MFILNFSYSPNLSTSTNVKAISINKLNHSFESKKNDDVLKLLQATILR